jgi:hypothetical protein
MDIRKVGGLKKLVEEREGQNVRKEDFLGK